MYSLLKGIEAQGIKKCNRISNRIKKDEIVATKFIKFLIPRPLAAGLPIKKGPGLALGFNTFY